MYDKTSLRILEAVYLEPGIHKRAISKKLKLGMPSVEYSLKKTVRILKEQRSGNQIRMFLDYSRPEITPLLYAIEHSRVNRLPSEIRAAIRDFLSKTKQKPLIALLFGSYARGDYSRESDVDVFLVFQAVGNSKEIENAARAAGMRSGVSLNPVYVDYDSFRKSFHDRTKAFFRNIRNEKILLAGIEWWRELEDEEA